MNDLNDKKDLELVKKIKSILKKGSSAEVKRCSDGSYKVYEVRKSAV